MTKISREVFEQQRRPRFGVTNPERMQSAFWEWMIRGDDVAPTPTGGSLEETRLMMREGKLKSAYGPYRVRDLFQIPMNRADGPIWTFERFGATQTELPDGRVICIGGEHEDSYDADFCIYNDVVVFQPDGEIEIYGYPKEVFPPTDFHTASLVGERIVIIGCLGYVRDRRFAFTPLYSLDTTSYSISEIATTGTAPGWLFKHEADLSAGGVISVRGGQFVNPGDDKNRFRRNCEDFALDVTTASWMQLTERNWRQWSIEREDGGLFVLNHEVQAKDLVPESFERVPSTEENYREARFLLRGVPIHLIVGVKWVEIVVEGELPEEIWRTIPEVFRNQVEVLCKKKCVVL